MPPGLRRSKKSSATTELSAREAAYGQTSIRAAPSASARNAAGRLQLAHHQ